MSVNENISGVFTNVLDGIVRMSTSFFIGLLVFVAVGIAAWFLFRWYRNLTFYKTPVSLTVLMENGTEKTRHDLKGGVFWNNNIRDFKIKIPKQRKPHILGYVPDFSKSSSVDGRLYFVTSGDRTIWQQYETRWVLKGIEKDAEGNLFKYDLLSVPVPRETKQLTVNSIKNWRDTVDKTKLTAFGIAIGGFIIMVIAHLISLFIQTRIKCGAG